MQRHIFYNEIDRFLEPLKNFSHLKLILFSAACCERAINFYQDFQIRDNWGDFSKIRQTLDLAWLYLENPNKPLIEKMSKALEDMKEVMPFADAFNSTECLLALGGWGAVYSLVEQCSKKEKRPEIGSSQIFESFYSIIGFSDLDKTYAGYPSELYELEVKVLNDVRIKKEMEFQKEDMLEITEIEEIDKNFITKLRKRAEKNKRSAKDFLNTTN